MVYSYKQLLEKYKSRRKVDSLIKNKCYVKLSRGIYSDNKSLQAELESIFLKCPNAILTLESAFAFYELSDYVPTKYVIATGVKSHRLHNNKIKQIYISEKLLRIGLTTIKTKSGSINIYDKERMLIELFRFKTKLGYDYFKEVVNSYRNAFKNNEIDIHKLSEYCCHFSNGNNILKNIQDIVI